MFLPTVGVSELHKFGCNLNVDTGAEEDIIPWGGLYVFPTVPFSPTIVSTSADDTDPSGDGARAVRVAGLDEDWLFSVELVTLNGTTPVQLTKTFIRINRVFIGPVGVAGTNVGTIEVLDGSNILAQIPAGVGQTQQLVLSIPANFINARLHGFFADCHVSPAADLTIDTNYRNFEQGWRKLGSQLLTGTSAESNHEHLIGDSLRPKSDLRVTATTTQNNSRITGHLYITANILPT